MTFNKKVNRILFEATGGYFRRRSNARNLQDAVREVQDNFRHLKSNSDHLKSHPEAKDVDMDSYKRVLEIIATLNQWGPKMVDKSGKGIDVEGLIKQALEMSSTKDHDFKSLTPETKITDWGVGSPRIWFTLYSQYTPFKAVNKRSIDTTRTMEADNIYYFGTDGLPYITRLSMDPNRNIEGTLFDPTFRFNDTMINQIKINGKPVLPKMYNDGKETGQTIPFRTTVKKLFGRDEVNIDELKKILNSEEAKEAFRERVATDEKLNAWFIKKYGSTLAQEQPTSGLRRDRGRPLGSKNKTI
jgi:hypothetical protein